MKIQKRYVELSLQMWEEMKERQCEKQETKALKLIYDELGINYLKDNCVFCHFHDHFCRDCELKEASSGYVPEENSIDHQLRTASCCHGAYMDTLSENESTKNKGVDQIIKAHKILLEKYEDCEDCRYYAFDLNDLSKGFCHLEEPKEVNAMFEACENFER